MDYYYRQRTLLTLPKNFAFHHPTPTSHHPTPAFHHPTPDFPTILHLQPHQSVEHPPPATLANHNLHNRHEQSEPPYPHHYAHQHHDPLKHPHPLKHLQSLKHPHPHPQIHHRLSHPPNPKTTLPRHSTNAHLSSKKTSLPHYDHYALHTNEPSHHPKSINHDEVSHILPASPPNAPYSPAPTPATYKKHYAPISHSLKTYSPSLHPSPTPSLLKPSSPEYKHVHSHDP